MSHAYCQSITSHKISTTHDMGLPFNNTRHSQKRLFIHFKIYLKTTQLSVISHDNINNNNDINNHSKDISKMNNDNNWYTQRHFHVNHSHSDARYRFRRRLILTMLNKEIPTITKKQIWVNDTYLTKALLWGYTRFWGANLTFGLTVHLDRNTAYRKREQPLGQFS